MRDLDGRHDAGPAAAVAGVVDELLLGGSLVGGGLLGVAGLEAGDAAAGVEDLLLAGVERVAVGAHVGVDHAVLRGAARRERVPAGAGHLGHVVVRVDVLLHGCPFEWRRVASPGWAGREPVPNRQSLPPATTPEPIEGFPGDRRDPPPSRRATTTTSRCPSRPPT